MTFQGFCPQCGTEIPRDRFVTGFAVCECGWCDATPDLRARKSSEKSVIATMIASSVILVALYAHMVSWGSYSASMPVLQLQKITGTLTKAGYLEMADACTALGKFDCAKDAYTSLYRAKNDLDGVAGFAKLSVRLNETQPALSAYSTYFRSGGNALDPMLQYAKLLEQTGHDDDAMKYYEAAAAGSGETLPVVATTGLVRLLMKRGDYEKAFEKIQAFHASAGNAKGYLNTELSQLETYLHEQAKSGGKKSKAGKHVASLR